MANSYFRFHVDSKRTQNYICDDPFVPNKGSVMTNQLY